MFMTKISSNKQLKAFYADRLNGINATSKAEPRCGYFGECGGCSMQNIKYEEQVALKLEALQQIFEGDELEVSMTPAPDRYYYRLKMDYVLTNHPIYEPHDRMGLRKRKNFSHVIDLNECHLIPLNWFSKLRSVYKKALDLQVPLYDLKTAEGDLRYFVIRAYGDKAMLNIVSKSQKYIIKLQILAEHALDLGFTSVYLLEQPELSDTSFGTVVSYVGDEHLSLVVSVDKEYVFKIGPNNFFQNNAKGFEQMMKYVQGEIDKRIGNSTVLYDIYGGVGTIGVIMSGRFKKVNVVELERSNVDMIGLNAKRNEADNVFPILADAREAGSYWAAEDRDSIAIVDPPRIGLMQQGVNEILKLSPKLFVYISCNPITQSLDLELLKGHYNVVSAQGFDMFPQTLHMENVLVLERR